MAQARMARSSVAPAGRDDGDSGAARPRLGIVNGGRKQSRLDTGKTNSVSVWARGRTLTAIHLVVAAVFLLASLFGSLILRTQMEENSFQQSQAKVHISQLAQDVQDDQTQLDRLQAQLPDKAQQMGMVPQQGANSIDLQGYQPPKDGQ